MNKLFTLIIGRKEYLTTNDAVAWDVCLRFGAELESVGQTNRTIDGLEYRERSLDDIFNSIKRLCAPLIKGFKGHTLHGIGEDDPYLKMWNYISPEEKLDGTRLHKVFPILIQHEDKFDEYGRLRNPDVLEVIHIQPRQMGRTVTMLKGIMSITGCSEEIARKVIKAKNAGDLRNIRDIAEEFKTI